MSFKRGQLRYFITIAEEGQITRAAVRLHIAQPALSQALAQFESELGVALLERHARGVRLTPAGEAFLPKARAAVAREQEAVLAARSLARAAKGVIEVGFVGPPPILTSPELFAEFVQSHPEAEITFRDLPFPSGATAAWLQGVDVAFCHQPAIGPDVGVQAVREEPRAVAAHRAHPLMGRAALDVADVLDETFIGFHPDVQTEWAGFHSLDDHRGGPPRSTTGDRAQTSLQMAGLLFRPHAVTTVPLCDARIAGRLMPDAAAVPLRDARPAVLSLTWRTDNHNPLVEDLAGLAASLAAAGGDLATIAESQGAAAEAPLEEAPKGRQAAGA